MSKKPRPQRDALAAAIKVLGGPVNAARILLSDGSKYQTIQSWLANRVPSDHCPAVERETRARGAVVTCEELRPDIPWGVLREQVADQKAAA